MSTTTSAAAAVEKPVRRFPPPCWTQDEALALIQSYRSRWYALRRGYLRTADWDAVADEVGRLCPGAAPPKTSAQCRHKMEKLRQRYRAEKQRAAAFSGGRFVSTWFYFEAMDSMERNGSNSDDVTNSGMQIVNLKGNNEISDSVYGGNRFKSVGSDRDLVTVASRAQNVRVLKNSLNYTDEDETEDVYYENPARFQSDNRARKFSKIGSNSNVNRNYWNENGEYGDNGDDDDDDDEDENWGKIGEQMTRSSKQYYFDGESEYDQGRGGNGKSKRESDGIGEIVGSIKVLAEGFMKMEKMKMDMVHEIEKMRMEAEMKRNKMLLESQKQIVEAFVRGLTEGKRRRE